MFQNTSTPSRPIIEMRISSEGITPATPDEVAEELDGLVSAGTILVLLRGLAAEDADVELIRSGIERLADALGYYDPQQHGRVARIGMLAGQGAPEHLRRALAALDAEDRGWTMQHLDNAYNVFVHPSAMAL
ncbi:hypothetical protein ACTXK0_05170 [Corynebacterium variabile]|uniref:hypothetical protein n=1 Tax=Corynebacterium variabile TaxID=1727 RepID=UPI003FD5BA67